MVTGLPNRDWATERKLLVKNRQAGLYSAPKQHVVSRFAPVYHHLIRLLPQISIARKNIAGAGKPRGLARSLKVQFPELNICCLLPAIQSDYCRRVHRGHIIPCNLMLLP